MSFRAFVVGAAVVLLLGTIGVMGFLWYQARTARGLALEFAAPDRILVGVPFDVRVVARNESRSVLRDAALSLILPDGVLAVGADARKTRITRALGNLGVRSEAKEAFTLIVTGGENTLQELVAAVTYAPTAVGGQFKREAKELLAVSGYGLTLDVVTPKKVFSGEEFATAITFRNESGADISAVRMKAIYPQGFAFRAATPKPDVGDAIWELGGVRAGGEGSIEVRGALAGPDGSFYDLAVELESNVLGEWYTIHEQSAAIAIEAAPLSLAVALNGAADYVVSPGEQLTYTFRYVNTTNIAMRDAVVQARLTGELFDLATVSSAASLRASDATLIWNAANTPALASIPAGGSGTVEFQIRLKPDYPIRRPSDRNFTLRVAASIESPTVPQFVGAERTETRVELETKVRGRTTVDAQGLFRDAAAGVANAGPFPPRVGQATQFTIHWIIRNYGTDVKNVEVRSFLGGNARVVSVVRSDAGTAPVYNDRTQELVWAIDRIPATRGVADSPLEAIVQIELTPSVAQVGTQPTLLQRTTLRATDEFTNETLDWGDEPITTELRDDPTLGGGSNRGAVVP